jgi:hypothetical protein
MTTSIEASLPYSPHNTTSISSFPTLNLSVKLNTHPTADLSMDWTPTPDLEETLDLPIVDLDEIQIHAKYELKIDAIHRRTKLLQARTQNAILDQNLGFLGSKNPENFQQKTQETWETPELPANAPEMVRIESEVTLGMGPNEVDQDFCRENEEVGGDLQGKVEKMRRLYLGGNAVWWFLGGCVSAVFAVVFGVWGMVEWANLGRQPNWAL